LRRLELELRAWLTIKVGKRGGASVATYEERLSVRCKATRRRGGGGFHRGVRLGHAWEEEDDDDADKQARGGSNMERGEKGVAACGFGWAGPLRDAQERLACWLRSEREKSCGLGQGGRGEGLRAKTEMKGASIYLFLFNFSNCILK
jgi:hypothetical protein